MTIERAINKNPCPFCGGEEIAVEHGLPDDDGLPRAVSCHACGSIGPVSYEDDNGEDAISQWNSRREKLAPAGVKEVAREIVEALNEYYVFPNNIHVIEPAIEKILPILSRLVPELFIEAAAGEITKFVFSKAIFSQSEVGAILKKHLREAPAPAKDLDEWADKVTENLYLSLAFATQGPINEQPRFKEMREVIVHWLQSLPTPPVEGDVGELREMGEVLKKSEWIATFDLKGTPIVVLSCFQCRGVYPDSVSTAIEPYFDEHPEIKIGHAEDCALAARLRWLDEVIGGEDAGRDKSDQSGSG